MLYKRGHDWHIPTTLTSSGRRSPTKILCVSDIIFVRKLFASALLFAKVILDLPCCSLRANASSLILDGLNEPMHSLWSMSKYFCLTSCSLNFFYDCLTGYLSCFFVGFLKVYCSRASLIISSIVDILLIDTMILGVCFCANLLHLKGIHRHHISILAKIERHVIITRSM